MPRKAAARGGKYDGPTVDTATSAIRAANITSVADAANATVGSVVCAATHDAAAANTHDGTATNVAVVANDGTDAAGNHDDTPTLVHDV